MKREELVRSKEFWLIQIQNNVFNLINDFKIEKKLNQTQVAAHIGVTKGYVSQILNGDYDNKVSKLVDLALAFNKAPIVSFIDLDTYVQNDKEGKNSLGNPNPSPIHYWVSLSTNTVLKVDSNVRNQLGQNFEEYFNSFQTVEVSASTTQDSNYSNYTEIEWLKK